METIESYTITGYRIAYPGDYWAELESQYPTVEERKRAQAHGLDHFGSYGLLGDYRCYRCGFLCEGDEE